MEAVWVNQASILQYFWILWSYKLGEFSGSWEEDMSQYKFREFIFHKCEGPTSGNHLFKAIGHLWLNYIICKYWNTNYDHFQRTWVIVLWTNISDEDFLLSYLIMLMLDILTWFFLSHAYWETYSCKKFSLLIPTRWFSRNMKLLLAY